MKKRLAVALALLLAFSLIGSAAAVAKPKVAKKKRVETWRVYRADLDPLNNSGVDGYVIAYVRKGVASVHVYADNLEPGQQHLQHIHGFAGTETDAVCPPMSAAGEDGILTLAEGLPFYGPVLLPLDLPDGSFPVPDECNEVHYMRTFTGQKALYPLDLRTAVVHGLTVNGTYDPTLPVACGEFVRKGVVKVRAGEIVKVRPKP